ncbi:MAG: hypothetical protein IPM37_11205 [Hahellaceae bacterium]|nr:hypothetical protein [Hahellaceae bacterium]
MKKFLVSLLLGSCAIASAWAGEKYPVEIVPQPDQEWRFQRLMAYSADNATKVSGRLTSNLPIGLPRGHVDVAAYTKSGELIAETTTDYAPAILTHIMKKKGGVRFSATFEKPLPSDAMVKVAFHRDLPSTKVNPSHSGNIAK